MRKRLNVLDCGGKSDATPLFGRAMLLPVPLPVRKRRHVGLAGAVQKAPENWLANEAGCGYQTLELVQEKEPQRRLDPEADDAGEFLPTCGTDSPQVTAPFHSPRLDVSSYRPHRGGSMKAASTAEAATNGHAKTHTAKRSPLRMTRRLAEKRAVGDARKPKFDGVALLRSLKK